MKIGVVVPYSWSYWGGVIEHAEHQAEALEALGHEVRIVCGHDPPGFLTKLFHPRTGRHGDLPERVIPVGRSVVVPSNGALPNVVLSIPVRRRIEQALEREEFDLLHLHEPMCPSICVVALAVARCPVVATWHAAGALAWMQLGMPLWGFLIDRIDRRIAVSEQARETAARWLPGEYEVIPNGIVLPAVPDPSGREHRVVFVGRQEPRKGLAVLLRAWPEIWRRTGARLRLIGTDPLQARLLLARLRVSDAGIDILGIVSEQVLTDELLSAKALVAPSLGGESFGMVLTRAFACATPAVASDIPGYADVMTGETGVLVRPGDPSALADAVAALLDDEGRRRGQGQKARQLAEENYAWPDIARRLEAVYERAVA